MSRRRTHLSPAIFLALVAIQLQLLLSCNITASTTVRAFSVPIHHRRWSSISSSSVLEVKKVKRAGLADLVEAGAVLQSPTRQRRPSKSVGKKPSSSSSSSSSAPPDGIAPGLADWVASKKQDSDTETDDDNNVVVATATSTNDMKVKNGKKGTKKSDKMQIQQTVEDGKVDSLLDQLDDALQQKGNLDGILSVVHQLFNLASGRVTGLKPLLASKPGRTGGQGSLSQYNFRLAWVGSDDALCYIGTGLHKVPLARMQEVFLSCLGRNRIEILEVISITGPFPNVRNTLQGETKLMKGGGGTGGGMSSGGSGSSFNPEKLRIAFDSMIDGTGKELLPPGAKTRSVDLDVYFSDERAIVAVVPPPEDDDNDTSSAGDPLRKNGQNVLVFVREDDLDSRLESLRVS